MRQDEDEIGDELEGFCKVSEHTNMSPDQFCCPRCLESKIQKGVSDEPKIVTCPDCGERFVAWTDTQEIYCSAALEGKS